MNTRLCAVVTFVMYDEMRLTHAHTKRLMALFQLYMDQSIPNIHSQLNTKHKASDKIRFCISGNIQHYTCQVQLHMSLEMCFETLNTVHINDKPLSIQMH